MEINELKLKYLLYRVSEACREIEAAQYKGGGAAYRHLQKGLMVCGYVENKQEIPTYDEMRVVELELLKRVCFGTIMEFPHTQP